MMIRKRGSDFKALLKKTLQESGLILQGELLNVINNSGTMFSALVGHELVLATFIPMLPELIFDEVKRRILQEDVEDLARKLENNKSTLNEDFIKSDYGQKLFKDIIKEIINEDEKSKRDYLKNFLISSYTQENVNKDFIKQCYGKLSQMSPIQLRILSIFNSPDHEVYSVASTMITRGKQEITIPDDFNEYDLRVDKMVFETALNDLKSFGMVANKTSTKLELSSTVKDYLIAKGHINPNPSEPYRFMNSLNVVNLTSQFALDPRREALHQIINVTKTYLTDFGTKFLQFVNT